MPEAAVHLSAVSDVSASGPMLLNLNASCHEHGLYTPGIHARHIILTNPSNNSKVHLIGCAHVDAQSSKDVQIVGQEFVTGPDDAVALELCPERSTQCLHPECDRRVYPESFWDTPFTNPLFWIGVCTDSLTCVLGGIHGGEQRMGAEIAQTCGAPIYLIDNDSSRTVTRTAARIVAGIGMAIRKVLVDNILEMEKAIDTEAEAIFGKELLAEAEAFKAEASSVHLTPDPWTDLHISTGRDMVQRGMNAIGTYHMMNDVMTKLPDALGNDRDYVLAHNSFRLSLEHKTTLVVLGAAHINGIVKLFGKTNEQEYLEKGGPATIPKYHGPVGTKFTGVVDSKIPTIPMGDIPTMAKVGVGVYGIYGGMVLGCAFSWQRRRKNEHRMFGPVRLIGRSMCTLVTVGITLGGLYGIKYAYDHQVVNSMKSAYDHMRRCQLETCRYDLKEGNIKSYSKMHS